MIRLSSHRKYTSKLYCPEKHRIVCAECQEAVELLTLTHIKNHAEGLIRTQEEYCRAHPEHSFLSMWGEMPEGKRLNKYKEWRRGKC